MITVSDTAKKKIKKLDTEISDITSSIVNLETDQILKRRNARGSQIGT